MHPENEKSESWKLSLTSPKAIRELLEPRGIKPSRGMGQNFLIDRNILNAIVDAGSITRRDHVLEVGPGAGVLTQELVERAGRVTAVEMDSGLFALLQERFGECPSNSAEQPAASSHAGDEFSNQLAGARDPEAEPCPRFCASLKLLHGDALDLDYSAIFAPPDGATCMVANLPYSVGTRVIVNAATCANPPSKMVTLVQKEVAERFIAAPSTPEYSAMSIWLQAVYCIRIARLVKPTCFWPQPDVTSAIVVFTRRETPLVSPEEMPDLVALTKAAFIHRRKQMCALFKSAGKSAMSQGDVRALLAQIGARPDARAETLDLSQWIAFTRAATAKCGAGKHNETEQTNGQG